MVLASLDWMQLISQVITGIVTLGLAYIGYLKLRDGQKTLAATQDDTTKTLAEHGAQLDQQGKQIDVVHKATNSIVLQLVTTTGDREYLRGGDDARAAAGREAEVPVSRPLGLIDPIPGAKPPGSR